MKRGNRTSLPYRICEVLHGNDGTSLVLVSIIAIIIITGVVILRVSTSALWASADKQLYQDQAYELATSMGESLNTLVVGDDALDLATFEDYSDSNIIGMPNAKIDVWVDEPDPSSDNNSYVLHVRSQVGPAEYIYTATYRASGTAPNLTYSRLY